MTLEKILKKLISFKTVTADRNANKKTINWLKNEFRRNDLYVKEFRAGGYPSLVATTRPTKKPKLFLAAHLDVVPASPKMFIPRKKKNKLIGRGAIDMKFAVACYLKLAQDLKKKNLKNYDFGIMITTDEEIGGAHGTKFLLAKGYRPKFAFLPDGGFNWQIEKKAKGVLHLKIESRGRTAHASRPWEGHNAISSLLDFLQKLKKLFPAEPCRRLRHYHNTLNIGKISGGQATNQVPTSATAFLDIRHVPETKQKNLLAAIMKLKKKFSDIAIVKTIGALPYQNNLNRPEIKSFKNLARRLYGVKMGKMSSHGNSDARFFKEKGIPVLSVRPRGGGHHTEQEWIDVKNLERYYQVLKNWIQK